MNGIHTNTNAYPKRKKSEGRMSWQLGLCLKTRGLSNQSVSVTDVLVSTVVAVDGTVVL